MSPPPPPPLLTLDNFTSESEVPENCPFVLTSPRSLEACRRAAVQVTTNIMSRPTRVHSPKYLKFKMEVVIFFLSLNLMAWAITTTEF